MNTALPTPRMLARRVIQRPVGSVGDLVAWLNALRVLRPGSFRSVRRHVRFLKTRVTGLRVGR